MRGLRKAACPAPYLVRVSREYSKEELRDARGGNFRFGGTDVNVQAPFDWTTDPVGSASFRGRLHDLRWLDLLLYDYREEGRRRSLRDAKRIAVDWVKNNPLSAPSTDRTWFDKVAGDRAAYLAYVVRAARCERMMNGRLARKMLGALTTHGEFLSDSARYPQTNRGLFVDLGLLLMGKQVRFMEGARRWRKRGEQRFARTVRGLTVRPEGFWLEHSTTYQFLAMNVIGRYLELKGLGRTDLREILRNMKKTAAWLLLPDNRWLQAGNSYRDRASKETRQRAKEARGLNVLWRSGLGFVRHGTRNYLSVLADFHGPTHKHSDEASFDLAAKQGRVISDTGMYSKDPGSFVAFQESSAAHSTLVVDGQDFSRAAVDAYGSGIVAAGKGAGWYAIEVANPLLRSQGVEHTRLFLFFPGSTLLVADQVRSSSEHDYRRYLQFEKGLKLDGYTDTLELRNNKGRSVATVISESTDPGQRSGWVKGQREPPLGLLFERFRDADKRWTGWFETAGSDLDHLLSISLKPNKLPRGRLAGPLDANPTRIVFEQKGEPIYTLVVQRDGASIAVFTEPPPYTEPTP